MREGQGNFPDEELEQKQQHQYQTFCMQHPGIQAFEIWKLKQCQSKGWAVGKALQERESYSRDGIICVFHLIPSGALFPLYCSLEGLLMHILPSEN